MRGSCLAIALLLMLGAAQTLWAGPFTEVPSGHWAYGACGRLAELGVLGSERASAFSGNPQLTRFEFGVAILEPLTEVDRAMAALPPEPEAKTARNAVTRALRVSPYSSEEQIAAGAADLRRLSGEFGDVLRGLGFEPGRAARGLQALDAAGLREWRAEALSAPGRALMALAPARRADDALRLPVGHGTVALSYDRDLRPPEVMDYLAASAAERGTKPDASGNAEPALRDPLVSRLRTAYEYGLGSALTLSLAYEEIARRGQGLAPLDSASFASLGIGYRLTPSASVKLSYSLLEYSNYVVDSPPLRDRMAETAVSIGF